MLRPGGYGRSVHHDGEVREAETFMCGHCGAHTWVKPKERPEDLGGFCRLCAKPVCAECHKRGGCDPLEAKLARVERTQDFRRWFLECA